jgi:hypothetical protein
VVHMFHNEHLSLHVREPLSLRSFLSSSGTNERTKPNTPRSIIENRGNLWNRRTGAASTRLDPRSDAFPAVPSRAGDRGNLWNSGPPAGYISRQQHRARP